MNLYWIYLLPNWMFGALTVFAFVVIGLTGLYLTCGWVPRLHRADHSCNDIVGFYVVAISIAIDAHPRWPIRFYETNRAQDVATLLKGAA